MLLRGCRRGLPFFLLRRLWQCDRAGVVAAGIFDQGCDAAVDRGMRPGQPQHLCPDRRTGSCPTCKRHPIIHLGQRELEGREGLDLRKDLPLGLLDRDQALRAVVIVHVRV